MHRQSEYFKKLQADFDSRVVKQGSKYNAKNSFGVDLTKVADAVSGVFAPKAPALALA